jgi:hypothetical protein
MKNTGRWYRCQERISLSIDWDETNGISHARNSSASAALVLSAV